jgi:hypothetical protein
MLNPSLFHDCVRGVARQDFAVSYSTNLVSFPRKREPMGHGSSRRKYVPFSADARWLGSRLRGNDMIVFGAGLMIQSHQLGDQRPKLFQQRLECFRLGRKSADVVAGGDPDTGLGVPESVYDAFACHEAVIPLVRALRKLGDAGGTPAVPVKRRASRDRGALYRLALVSL